MTIPRFATLLVLALILWFPQAIVAQPEPRAIYIADAGNDRIVRITSLTGTGWTAFGRRGSGTNQLQRPWGIAFDSAGRIYIVDGGNNRVVRINDMTGAGWTVLGGTGSAGPENQFRGPTGIAIDSSDRIYVADTDNHRIVRVNDMAGSGWTALRGCCQDAATSRNAFDQPTGIALDSAGHIFVADAGSSRIVRVDDMTSAGWIAFGNRGSGVNEFTNPAAIGVDSTGRIYVLDTRIHRLVRVADMTGAGWTTLTGTGNGVGQFGDVLGISGPLGLYIDLTGRIYVADTFGNRIVRMNDLSGAGWTTYGKAGTNAHEFIGPIGIFVQNK